MHLAPVCSCSSHGCAIAGYDMLKGKPGIISCVPGFAGGRTRVDRLSHQSVISQDGSQHAIQVIYDPAKTDYLKLLEVSVILYNLCINSILIEHLVHIFKYTSPLPCSDSGMAAYAWHASSLKASSQHYDCKAATLTACSAVPPLPPCTQLLPSLPVSIPLASTSASFLTTPGPPEHSILGWLAAYAMLQSHHVK